MGVEVNVNTGERYGMLTVIKEADRILQPGGIRARAFLCKCDCGNEKIVRLSHLRHKRVNSCGCLVGEKHGLCKSKIYTTWRGMKNRCYGGSYKEKKYYQDKGIEICEEWKNSFTAFYNWSINNGYVDGLTIDRRNSNEGYTPNNSRWITPFENMLNTGISKTIIYHGREIFLAEMWKNDYFRLHMAAIRIRIKRGYSINDAFDIPIKTGKYKCSNKYKEKIKQLDI